MSLVDRNSALASNTTQTRFFVRRHVLLRELLRARQRGNKIDNEFVKESVRAPR